MNFGFLRELFTRYGHALVETGWTVLVALAVSAALVLPPVRRRLAGLPPWTRFVGLGLLAAGAALWAWQLRWLCDDAYISFRYAENLAGGHGLVFNPGEHVEGYTNFLWTVLIAGFIRLGADPGQVAIVLGIGCFLALIALLARLGERAAIAAGGVAGTALPGLAPLLAASSYTAASFATSGLETMFAATLAVAALERAEARRPFLAGLAAVGAAMAHPDHGIFYAALGAALLTFRDRRREALRYALPFVLVYVPYFLWRWRYYGDFVPNTFHAKSADRTYFSQGSVYLAVTFVSAGLFGVMPLALLGAVRARQTLTARFALIGVPLFALYIGKIGGDFMLGRLLTPAMAFVFLLADLGLRDLLARERWRTAAALMVPAALAALPARVILPGEKKWHIADERTFYLLSSFSPVVVNSFYTHQGRTLAAMFPPGGVTPKLAVGCVGIVGYLTKLPIFDLYGLTSRSVARMPIVGRGRPGHEKLGTAGHVWEAGADLSDTPLYPEPYTGTTALEMPGFRFYLPRYDRTLLATARAHGGVATDVPVHLDQMALSGATRTPDQVACDLWFQGTYYFAHNPDPERRDRAIRDAVAVDPSLRGTEDLLLTPAPPQAQGYRPIRRLGFDEGERWAASGDAFARWPSAAAVPGQSAVFGQEGPFVNTFTFDAQDRARGVLTSAAFVIEGDVITLMVGGGRHAGARAALVVGGQEVRSATGCFTEVLGRRVWNVADLRGQTAQVRIVDETDEGWGHVVVDEIIQWRRDPESRAAVRAGGD